MSFSTNGLKPNKPSNLKTKPAAASPSPAPVAKPSDRLKPKTVDLFNTREIQKTAFGTIYSNGGIPCRLVHGSVKNRLMWNQPPEHVDFDPVLVTLADGLRETSHPFNFVAQAGFRDLLETHDADEKAIAVLPKLIVPIKNAMASPDDSVFEAGLNALMQLSDAVGPYLNQHLKVFLSILCKRMTQKKFKNEVNDALNKFEQNGGRETVLIIKSKIPTYNCVL